MSAETLLNARRARRCGYCTVICETVTCCFWFEVGYPKVVMTGDCSHVGAARRIQLNKYFHLLSCYMHVYVYLYIYIYLSIYIYTHIHTHTDICIYIHVYAHTRARIFTRMAVDTSKTICGGIPTFFSGAFCKKQPYVSWKHHGFLHFLSLRHESLRNP